MSELAWEQACRQRWQALLLAIKAMLEAVAAGIAQFEDEFLAYLVDPTTNGTVGDLLRPQLEQRYLGSRRRCSGCRGPSRSGGQRPLWRSRNRDLRRGLEHRGLACSSDDTTRGNASRTPA